MPVFLSLLKFIFLIQQNLLSTDLPSDQMYILHWNILGNLLQLLVHTLKEILPLPMEVSFLHQYIFLLLLTTYLWFQHQSLFQQRSCTFRWYHYCFALPVGVFACTSRIISGKHVPQDVSAPSIVKVQSEELSEPLLRLWFLEIRGFSICLPCTLSVLGATKSDMILELFWNYFLKCKKTEKKMPGFLLTP